MKKRKPDTLLPTDRTRGNGQTLKKKKLNPSEHKKTLFTVRVTKFCNRLSREVVEFIGKNIQNLTGHGPEQPALGGLAWGQGGREVGWGCSR